MRTINSPHNNPKQNAHNASSKSKDVTTFVSQISAWQKVPVHWIYYSISISKYDNSQPLNQILSALFQIYIYICIYKNIYIYIYIYIYISICESKYHEIATSVLCEIRSKYRNFARHLTLLMQISEIPGYWSQSHQTMKQNWQHWNLQRCASAKRRKLLMFLHSNVSKPAK